MTASVLSMRKPTLDPGPALLPGQRQVRGCGGHLEVHGAGASAAGLYVVCGHVTVHRHASGLPACEGADIPQRVVDAAATSEAVAWHLARLAEVGQ